MQDPYIHGNYRHQPVYKPLYIFGYHQRYFSIRATASHAKNKVKFVLLYLFSYQFVRLYQHFKQRLEMITTSANFYVK